MTNPDPDVVNNVALGVNASQFLDDDDQRRAGHRRRGTSA